jgi:hypothetical protein
VPHAPDAERSVLGAILVEPAGFRLAAEILAGTDFLGEDHRRIFAVMVALDARDVTIDPVTVKEELAARGDLEVAGGPAYIASLMDGVPRSANIEWYARIVKEKARDRATLLAADALTRAIVAQNGAGPGEGREDIRAAGGALIRAVEDIDRPSAAPADLARLLAEPETSPVAAVEGLVEIGAASLGSAPPKTWKTTMSVAAGLAVAAGVPFAGRLATTRAPFLHVDAEMGPRRTLALYRRLGRGEGIDVARLARDGMLHYLDATRPGPAREPRLWARLVRERTIGLVLLDPAVALFAGDENAAGEVRAWWASTVRPLLDEGAAVLIVHHNRKGSPLVADNASDAARGSGDWRGAPDLHFGIRAEPADRRLLRVEVTGSRLGPEPPPFYLRVQDHDGGLRIRWAGEAAETIGKTAAAADAIEDLLDRAGDGGLPRQAILVALGEQYHPRTLEDALALVRERGSADVRRVGMKVIYRRLDR